MPHITTAFAPLGVQTNVGLPGLADAVYDHDVVALPDGGFVMLWHGIPDPDAFSTSGLYLQRYDAQGSAVGDLVTAVAADTSPVTAFSALLPSIALLEDGRLALTYWNIGSDNDGNSVSQILLRLIDDDLQTVGAPQVLQPTNGAFDAQVSDITALENGGYAVAWEIGGFFTGGGLIRVQTFDENGPVLEADGLSPAAPVDIGLTSSPFATSSMISLSGSGFAVLYQDYDGVNSDVNYELYVQFFDDHGAAIGTPREIISQPYMFNPKMVQMANGQLVVAWYRSLGTFNDLLEFQILDASGAPVGDVQAVTGINGTTYIQDPELEALSEGGFVLSFLSSGGSYVQVHDASGTPQGVPLLVSDDVSSSADQAQVTALAGGGLVVTWAHQGQYPVEQAFFQLLEEVDPHGPIEGSDGDDTLTGTEADDTLAGADGNDSIGGGDGNDGIFGQDGDDTLDGGAGDDNIGGGAGADVVLGGDGNDTMGGGIGNDTLEGGGGSDFMGGGQGDDLMSGGDGNDIVNGGPGDDFIRGDDGNDTMGASFGNDTVDGGAGDDSIGGGTGRDGLTGGNGNDSIGGGEGDDTIDGGVGNDFLGGGGRDDVLIGSVGNDSLNGGTGNDTMTGGVGADQFIFNEFNSSDVDLITDFENGLDTFRMTGIVNAPGSGLQGRVDALNITDAVFDGQAGVTMTYDGHVIHVFGVSAADLGIEDFVFV